MQERGGWWWRRHEANNQGVRDAQPSLNAGHTAVLRAIPQERLRASLDEVTRELFRRAGVKVSTVTVRKALRGAGIERHEPLRRSDTATPLRIAAPMAPVA
jgi:transposase